MTTIWHYTCDHGAPGIRRDGIVKPSAHPLLGLPPAEGGNRMTKHPHSRSKNRKPDHSTCENTIRSQPALAGLDVTLTTRPPLVRGPYTTDGFTCPHDITYWLEPTGEQIAKWVADGTP